MKRLFSRGPRRKESKGAKSPNSPKKGSGSASIKSVSSTSSTPTIQEDIVTTLPTPVNVTIGRSSKIKQLRDHAVAQLEDLLAEKLEGKPILFYKVCWMLLLQ